MPRRPLALICAMLATLCPVAADTFYPPEGWTDQPDPLASPYATVGGEISIFGGQSPNSLNYYLDASSLTQAMFASMFDSLLTEHSITLDYEPGLAERWSISDDKKTFTFWLDPQATWSDGTSITAHDVKWTFDAIMAPENLTGPHKVYLDKFESPEVVEDLCIRFSAKKVHWRNLAAAGGFAILPRHVFADKDFNLIHFEFPVVSGLYRLGEFKESQYVDLERRDDYWNRESPGMQGVGNFQRMRFKFFAERPNAFEAFKKGQIDIFPVYTSRIWVTETGSEAFEKNWIVKQKVTNYEPIRLQGFPMNMRKPPFDDVRVRKAMAHALDIDKMNETLMYSQYKRHRSYFEDLWNAEHPCPREPLAFDKDLARKLLAEAGWKPNPETGILEKDGRPFEFSMLERDPSFRKFYAIYAEDLKDIGVTMNIVQKDWASWVKDMDNFNFEMTSCAWGQSVRKDPEAMWHSRFADQPSGFNYPGFQNEKVDALIEQTKTIFDVEKRHEIVREIEQLIYDEHPYALTWYTDYIRLAYWNKFGMPPWVLSKFGDERSAYNYWWLDYDNEADLLDAMDVGEPLPPREFHIRFDDKYPPEE